MRPRQVGSSGWTWVPVGYVPVFIVLEDFRMNRALVFGIAMFFAVVGIALVGGEKSSAVAGLGCHGCGGCGGGLLSRLGSRCCGEPASCCEPAPAPSCSDACNCGGGLFSRLRNRCCGAPACCEPAPAPSCCEPDPCCGRQGLLARLKARRCCGEPASCCDPAPACCAPVAPSCAGAEAPAAEAPKAAPKAAPAKEAPAPKTN